MRSHFIWDIFCFWGKNTTPWDFCFLYAPPDFSNIHGYPNQSHLEWASQIPWFYGDTHLVEQHISLFCGLHFKSEYCAWICRDENVCYVLNGRCKRLVQYIRQSWYFIFCSQAFLKHWAPTYKQDHNNENVEEIACEKHIVKMTHKLQCHHLTKVKTWRYMKVLWSFPTLQ